MKTDEVPQDTARAFQGQRKVMYAVDSKGKYTATGSSGWEAEEIVLHQAIAHFEALTAQAHRRVREGRSSPLEYHMYRCRMDLTLLAQSTHFFKWRVRRHLTPKVFSRLSPAILQRYADALGISITALRELPDETERVSEG